MKELSYIYLALLLLVLPLEAQLLINEFQSSNSSTINDPDFDESADWIELYNAGEMAVDLSGHFLSDDKSDSSKWQFPTRILQAKAHVLVWADGRDFQMHSNFKLSSAGEEIALYSPTGELLDYISYEAQRSNLSQGRETDGATSFAFFQEPTPGSSNNTEAFSGLTFYRPQFSERGGIKSTAFDLELTSLGGEIRYTLDGSTPTLNSTLYSTPISIDSSRIVRSAVFEEGFISGYTSTQSYFFDPDFVERNLPIVSISGNAEYFWDPSMGIYVQDFKPEWEYPINVELFENDGSDRAAFNELAGVKVKGQASWRLPQKMLGISFDNEYENNNIDYPLFSNESRRKFSSFLLRPAGSDWSRALMRDPLGQEVSRDFLDVNIQNYRPSRVYINGQYMGIHNIRPSINGEYMEENVLGQEVDYDLIENYGNVEEGDSIDFHEFFDLIAGDLSDDGNYEALKEVIDMESFIDFFIAEIWSSNTSYGHNIKWYKPKSEGAKWQMILADLDRGFFWEDGFGMSYFTEYDVGNSYYIWIRDAFKNMLLQEDIRQLFISRFNAHLYCTYNQKRTIPFLYEMRDRIAAEVPYHVERWEGAESDAGSAIESYEFWREKVDDIESYLVARQEFMRTDLASYFELGTTTTLDLLSYPKNAGTIYFEGLKLPEAEWTGKVFEGIFIGIEAESKPGYEFQGWLIPAINEVIAFNNSWNYLDTGAEPESNWKSLNFDDTNWKSGIAPLGYGDTFLNTNISYGSENNQKHIAYYFRHVFEYESISNSSGRYILRLKADDGAIVYLNGQAIASFNFTDDIVDSNSFALAEIDLQEDEYMTFFIDEPLNGSNVLAVEVHQASGASDDVNFDCGIIELQDDFSNLFEDSERIIVNLQESTIIEAVFAPLESACFLPLEVEENLLLEASCSPYYAQGMTIVKSGAKLEIEEGVEILFPTDGGLFVEGSLEVKGTEGAPVIFKASSEEAAWKNVHFQYAEGESQLNYLKIENASTGNHSGREKAALTAFQSVVRCENLEIVDVEADPIFTQYSDFYLDGGKLHAKITGDFVNVKYGNAEVRNVDFQGNDEIDTDGIDYDEVVGGIIDHCRFENFLGFNSDGVDLGEQCEGVLLTNSFFRNCSDKAVSVGQRSTVLAENNTIVSCQQGFGIKDEGEIELDGISTYNVAVPAAVFEKNKGRGGGILRARNSIFSNSVNSTFEVDENSFLSFEYCLSDDVNLLGGTNLFTDPRFVDPNSLMFDLEIGSPAAGSGLLENGQSIDLGDANIYWNEQPDLIISEIHYHPAIAGGSEFIRIDNPGEEEINMEGYTIDDAIQFAFPAGFALEAGAHIYVVEKEGWIELAEEEEILEWESGNLSNGGERILLKNASGIVVDHVRYDDEGNWPIEADGMGQSLQLKSLRLDNHFGKNWEQKELAEARLVLKYSELTLFPNPAHDFLNVTGETIESLRILASDGRVVHQEFMSPIENYLVDISKLPPGIYRIQINNHQVRPFVKVR